MKIKILIITILICTAGFGLEYKVRADQQQRNS
jgi:hypothetical protein